MVKYGIPTAAFGTFSNFEEAKAYIEEQGTNRVKADGLALGRVVWSWRKPSSRRSKRHGRCSWTTSSVTRVPRSHRGVFGGEEFSLFALVSSSQFYILPTARDHKRAFDGDQGPNTGTWVPTLSASHISKCGGHSC